MTTDTDVELTIGPPLELIEVVEVASCLHDGTVAEVLGQIREQGRRALGREIDLAEAVACLDRLRAEWRTAAAARPPTGFELNCWSCFGMESDLLLDLGTLDTITCTRCGEVFTVAKAIRELTATLAPWERLAEHLDALKAAGKAAATV